MDRVTIGVDIGASAVRAAELAPGRQGPVLQRYAQVGLPPGAVVDGEITDVQAVAAALRRLWAEGGFSERRVVLGISGHRVIVRQAEVPALDEEDLRSALKFDAQELIPIPIEDACVDFSILDRGDGPGEDGKSTMRILLVAAHKEMLAGRLQAAKAAGLDPVAIDAVPLALLRVVPRPPDDTVEALVSIGAELTTVAVRDGEVPRFIRSLTIGGNELTSGMAGSLGVELAIAERLKRQPGVAGAPPVEQLERAARRELDELAEEVRATVDFFGNQSGDSAIGRVLLTGGASQTALLQAALAHRLRVEVAQVNPFAAVRMGSTGLTDTQLARASASAATAIGLALWSTQSPLTRLSVLPGEVAEARRARRVMALTGLGVLGFAVLLGAAAVVRTVQVHDAQHQVRVTDQQVAILQRQVSTLQAQTAVHRQAQAQARLVESALAGDVDWVRVLGQLAAVMPSDVSLSSFSGTTHGGGASTAASSSSSTGSLGALSFNVTGNGGLPAVAAWLHGLQSDPDLRGTWVSGIAVSNGGGVTFSSTSGLTSVAESGRAKEVSGS